VARKHADGAAIAAVCGGVFLLADSGLLNGRRATTHWMFAAELQRRHPELRVDSDRKPKDTKSQDKPTAD
jgi:transcriptional regulator GlxA family with amidase domain